MSKGVKNLLDIRFARSLLFKGGMAVFIALFGCGRLLGNSRPGWELEGNQLLQTDPQEDSLPKKRKKIHIEFFGGIASVSASDLNLLVDRDNRLHRIQYDDYLDFLAAGGELLSWKSVSEKSRRKLEGGTPFGILIRYSLSRAFSLSAGVNFLFSDRKDQLFYEYDRMDFSGSQDVETLRYSPYSLSVWAAVPMLGIQYLWEFGDSQFLEVFLRGGLVFAGCAYLTDWNYSWIKVSGQWEELIFSGEGFFEQKGSGTGAALEGGLRLGTPLTSHVVPFCEAGYSHMLIPHISGKGREVLAGFDESWEGEWFVCSEKLAFPWAEADVDYPTNHPQALSPDVRSRRFSLDLSGFFVRAGLSFRF